MTWGCRSLRAGGRGVWRAPAGAAGLVLVLLVAGCDSSDDGVGTVTPDVSASAVATPVVIATPPALPGAKPTPASAIAFVRYFWEAYNYAYQTYDTAALEAISKASCKYCVSAIDDIEEVAKAKTVIQGYRVKVLEAASPPVRITTGTVVVAACSQNSGKSVYPDGQSSVLRGFSASNFTFALQWADSRWLVEGIDYGQK